VDHYSGRSTVDSRPGQGDALTGAWRTVATEGGSSPQKHLENEGTEGNLTVGEGGSTGAKRGRRRGAVAVEARWGWCSSRRGWKMRAGITTGYGVGAHSAFYRAGEEGSGGGRGVTDGGSMELQGVTVLAMKWGEEWMRR
jgi:hypothetical protein